MYNCANNWMLAIQTTYLFEMFPPARRGFHWTCLCCLCRHYCDSCHCVDWQVPLREGLQGHQNIWIYPTRKQLLGEKKNRNSNFFFRGFEKCSLAWEKSVASEQLKHEQVNRFLQKMSEPQYCTFIKILVQLQLNDRVLWKCGTKSIKSSWLVIMFR